MIELQFSAEGQVLSYSGETITVYSDTIGQFQAVFEIDEWWDDYTVKAQFTTKETLEVDLTDGVCVIPFECWTSDDYYFDVTIFGADGTGNRKTANAVRIYYERSGFQDAAGVPSVITPTIRDTVNTLVAELKGGTAGQALLKTTNADYALEWGSVGADNVDYKYSGEGEGTFEGTATDAFNFCIDAVSEIASACEVTENKSTSITSESTDTQYASAKASWTLIQSIIPTVDSPNLWELETGLYWVTGTPHRTSNAVYDLTLLGKSLFIIQNYGNGVRYLRQNNTDVMGIRGFMNGWCNGTFTATEGVAENGANKALEITSSANNSTYPSAKAVWDFVTGRNLLFTDVSASVWTEDTTYSGYGYKCELSLTGVTPTMIPTVTFAHAEAVSGNYSPVALSGTETVTIYGKVNTSITIPLIKAEVV